MLNLLSKWLKVYRDEIGLFLWSGILFFLIRSSNVIFDNYAETTFLKRFGVEYLPMVYMVNAVVTFFLMGGISGLMARMSDSKLLMWMLLFSGASVGGLRFAVSFGIDLVYPVLYILKTQYEIILGLFFWDMANDLFNTRQSKRIFPLITAGGVLGGVIGSLGTPFIGKAFSFDNILFAYLGTSLLGAAVVRAMSARYPDLLLSEQKSSKRGSGGSSMINEIRKTLPLLKESRLMMILVVLTFVPNVIVPIMNYLFNFAVNETYATEGKMLTFFSYFRSFQNGLNFVILLFVGRMFGRWGLPVALMFHPINYLLSFALFLFRFDIFSASYARISTIILRTTINNPARAVLVGLFPPSLRGVVRPFLRGTVVRVGTLIGSGLIILVEGVISPASLSYFGIGFTGMWIVATFLLKRSYSEILLDLISKDMLDLKSMEQEDLNRIFKDKKMHSQLVQGCLSADGDECLWYAGLLNSLEEEELDRHILAALKDKDDRTRVGLLSLLTSGAGKEAIPVLKEMLDPRKPELMLAIAQAANRLDPEIASGFLLEMFESSRNPEVRAYAVAGLFPKSPVQYRETLESWLHSNDPVERRGGVIAAGQSGDPEYIGRLEEMLKGEEDESVLPFILQALHRLNAPALDEIVGPYLNHPSEPVREAALQSFDIEDEPGLRRVIDLLNDPTERIHDLAKVKLGASPYQDPQVLIESLAVPRRRVREGLFYLLESLEVRDVEIVRFGRRQLEKAYRTLALTEALERLPEGSARDLLLAHLEQRREMILENILRVLASQDQSGQMRIIWRGIHSADSRRRSNSFEALEGLLESSLSRIMIPILEGLPVGQALPLGRKHFSLPRFDSDRGRLYSELLEGEDGLTRVLTLYLLLKQGRNGIDLEKIRLLASSGDRVVSRMAGALLEGDPVGTEEEPMKTEMTMPDKILHLKRIQIFEDLSVSELAAIASVSEEVPYPAGEVVITQGEPGDTMYLVIRGEVAVMKSRQGGEGEIELDRIGAGDSFGEMALFEDVRRSATIRTVKDSDFLVLNKQEFTEIVREYPQIALHICKILSQRIRRLHEKIQPYEKESDSRMSKAVIE